MTVDAARRQILSPDRVRRILKRIAFEVIERNRGAENVQVIGIRRRGCAVAAAIASEIGRIEHRHLDVQELDVTPFRDDLDPTNRSERPPDESTITGDITDRDVVLVDDVLFTGRTARAALDALVQYGRPRTIQLAVLIDRGHREYPIQPDYLGRFFPTKYGERVVVEVGEGFAVYVEE